MSYENEKLDGDVRSSATFTKPNKAGFVVKIRKKKLHAIINDFKRKIGRNLQTKLSHVFNKPNLMMATLLDPRFKGLCFDEDQLNLAAEYVKTEVLFEINRQKKDVEEIESADGKRQKLDTVSFLSKVMFQIFFDDVFVLGY